jgi:hypothetical protein
MTGDCASLYGRLGKGPPRQSVYRNIVAASYSVQGVVNYAAEVENSPNELAKALLEASALRESWRVNTRAHSQPPVARSR